MNTHLGASINLQPNDIPEFLIQSADIIYVEGYLYDAPEGPKCWEKIGNFAKNLEQK